MLLVFNASARAVAPASEILLTVHTQMRRWKWQRRRGAAACPTTTHRTPLSSPLHPISASPPRHKNEMQLSCHPPPPCDTKSCWSTSAHTLFSPLSPPPPRLPWGRVCAALSTSLWLRHITSAAQIRGRGPRQNSCPAQRFAYPLGGEGGGGHFGAASGLANPPTHPPKRPTHPPTQTHPLLPQ